MRSEVALFEVDRTPFDQGTLLVEASAGTGKTFNISMSVVRLLLETGMDGRPLVDGLANVLAVTFTNAATNELVTGIREMLHLARDVWTGSPVEGTDARVGILRRLAARREDWAISRMDKALSELDSLAVFTIHGFCKRALEEFALESGTPFGVKLLDDMSPVVRQAVEDWWRSTFYGNRQLAALAVEWKWSPERLADDFHAWRRWPGAVIEPAVSVDVAFRDMSEALGGLLSVCSIDEVKSRAKSIEWNNGALLGTEAGIGELEGWIGQLNDGDFASTVRIAKALCKAELTRKARRVGKENRKRADELSSWEVVLAADQLDAKLTVLKGALRTNCLKATGLLVQSIKYGNNTIAFDDLLGQMDGVLKEQGSDGLLARAVRRQYQAVMIDEFQDTDSHQYNVFRTTFTGRPLILVGDPKQAIYGFRGADLGTYLRASGDAEHRYTLHYNYRSTPEMVRAVNAVFSRLQSPFIDKRITFIAAEAKSHPAPPVPLDGAPLRWLYVPPQQKGGKYVASAMEEGESLLFHACADHIVGLINDGWKPGNIAVLVRTGSEGAEMVRLLASARVPAVLSGIDDVMQSREMEELRQILEAVSDPRNFSLIRAAMATSLWGCSYEELREYASPAGERDWEAALTVFAQLHELWLTRGVLHAIEHLLVTREVLDRYLAFEDGDRRLTNLRHAEELLHEAERQEALGMERLIGWLNTVRSEPADKGGVRELRLESDDEAVQVMTIHRSKGLQFDIVFCPTLWRVRLVADTLPVLVQEGDARIFDHGSEHFATRRVKANIDRLAEDCRLAYVALTRARFRTYVGCGPIGGRSGSENSALAWLLYNRHPPQGGDTPADDAASVAASLKKDPGRWERMLQVLVSENPLLMAVEEVSEIRSIRRKTAVQEPGTTTAGVRVLPPSPSPQERFSGYSIASYTMLSKRGPDNSRTEDGSVVARDIDDADDSQRVGSVHTKAVDLSDFRTFPRGPRTGDVLHDLFENAEFDDDNDRLRETIDRGLAEMHFNDVEHTARVDAVLSMMTTVLRGPMGSFPFSLDMVLRAHTRREWQFLLPLASAHRPVTQDGLAGLFERYGGARGTAYARRLRQLHIGRIHGFLTGFVDLLFEYEGRWYIVDWKSNHLGSDPLTYLPDALAGVMDEHHFTMQYHFYLVAVHRLLRHRLPGYRYATHMGGAAYAFLRGLTPDAPSGSGWYTDVPPEELIEALSSMFGDNPIGVMAK